MDGYKENSLAVYDIRYHVIWVTKFRYKVLHGQIAIRTQELIRQGCEARGITILRGSVGKYYIHLLLSCPPSMAPSQFLQYLKGRSSRFLQNRFPELKEKYWGQQLWARDYFCAAVGTVDEETIRNYIANQFSEEKNETFRMED